MIVKFAHQAIEDFFTTGNKTGIHPTHTKKLSRQLTALKNARKPEDMGVIGWDFRSCETHCSIKIAGDWRLSFAFEDKDVVILNYLENPI
jgi:proteic killer suppression protein